MQIIRKAVIPLYLNYNGNRRSWHVKRILESWTWSAEQAKEAQRVRLAETLKHALEQIPFYQDQVDLTASDIRPDNAEEALLHFPILTPEMVKTYFEELQIQPRPKGAFLNRSGGTTGVPTCFYLDQASEDWVRGIKRTHQEAMEYRLGEKKWVIWGSMNERQRKQAAAKTRLIRGIVNIKRIQGFSLSNEELDEILAGMQKEKPKLLLAYVDILYRLAERAEETGLDMPKDMKMKVTAGTLYPTMRRRIERVFGPSLFNCYGSREFGDMALSCKEKQGLHIQGLVFYVEAIDENNQRVEMNETGELLITTMVNQTMPLIRYRIGDRGSLSNSQCSCGNPWSRIEQIEGRSQDLFYAKNGRKISPNALVHFCWVYGMEYQTRVQIIQRDYGRIEVHLLDMGKPHEIHTNFEKETKREMENIFQEPLRIDIMWKKELAYAPSGKFRMIQRRMDE